MGQVPEALIRDDEFGFAVYSFELGTSRFGAELTRTQVEAIASFAAALHCIHLETPGAEFTTSLARH